jgi:hypothetical protein
MHTKSTRQAWEDAAMVVTGILLDNLLDEIEASGGKPARVEFLRQLSQSNLERAGVKFDACGNAILTSAFRRVA